MITSEYLERFPSKVSRLNSWIENNFQVFEGPSRAYFELSFPVTIGWALEEERSIETMHRVPFIPLSFIGNEEVTCKYMAAVLAMCCSKEQLTDRAVPLFIRSWFTFNLTDNEPSYLWGRLAFWNPKLNRFLMKSKAYKPEGALANFPGLPEKALYGY